MITTIERLIARHAATHPDKIAIATLHEQLTYAAFNEAINRRADAFTALDNKAQLFESSQTPGFLIDYFAMHRAGVVAVPVSNSLGNDTRKALQQQLEQTCFPTNSADVLYTTGTTGQAKGVLISHEAIMANAENLMTAQGYTADTVFIICGPINHLGSLSKLYPTFMQGATIYLLEGLNDLNAFFNAFHYPSDKFATFMVPAHLRMLIHLARQQLKQISHKLDFIETGAAPMQVCDMEELCRLLPTTRLYNTYASTETGIIATHNFNEDQCWPGCVGRAMKHASFSIMPQGTIACAGPTLMTEYVGDAEATQKVKHDGQLFTEDLGHIDAQGRLFIDGRHSEVINIGGYKVAPTDVEAAALAHPGVSDCICIATPHPITDTALKLLVVCKPGAKLDKRALAQWLQTRLETYQVPMQYEEVTAIKRTFNGKLDRKAYCMKSFQE